MKAYIPNNILPLAITSRSTRASTHFPAIVVVVVAGCNPNQKHFDKHFIKIFTVPNFNTLSPSPRTVKSIHAYTLIRICLTGWVPKSYSQINEVNIQYSWSVRRVSVKKPMK